MAKTAAFAFVALVLSGCATSGASGIAPAHQAEVRAGPSVQGSPSVLMAVLPGWQRFGDGGSEGAIVGFRNDEARAVITARIIPAGDASLGSIIRGSIEDLSGLGAACAAPTVVAESYATARCVERRSDPPTRSIIAVRRPSGRPDVLLVMVGSWPDTLAPAFDEEVDLMFLMASTE